MYEENTLEQCDCSLLAAAAGRIPSRLLGFGNASANLGCHRVGKVCG